MAETKVSGRDYILLADINNDGTFLPVACLTTNSLTSTNDTIDATSKCGNQYTPSPVFTPSKDSYQQLYTAHAAKTIFTIKMGKATPTAGDVYYGGLSTSTVFISDFGVQADDGDDVKFTATFVVSVPPITQTETV